MPAHWVLALPRVVGLCLDWAGKKHYCIWEGKGLLRFRELSNKAGLYPTRWAM